MNSVLTISLKKISEKTSIDSVYNEIWTWLFKNSKKYCSTKGGKEVINYYLEECFEDSWFDEELHCIYFSFPEPGGQCGTSAAVSYHWYVLSLKQLIDPLNSIIKDFGYTIISPDIKTEDLFLEIDGKINRVIRSGSSTEIINDNYYINLDETSPLVQKKVKGMINDQLCLCPMCIKLRNGTEPVKVKSIAKKRPKDTYFQKLSTALRYPDFAETLHVIKEYTISPDISKLTALKELCIYDGTYENIPEEIGSLANLKELRLSFSHIESPLPDSIGNLQNLNLLDINIYWGLKEVPDTICNLSNLRHLEVSSNELQSIPEKIGDLISLELLKISGDLASIPASIMQLKRLKTLEIVDCKRIAHDLEQIDYSQFPCLESLTIERCDIKTFPSSILQCRNLKKLNLNDSKIEEIPGEIKKMISIESLDLDNAGLREIPEEIYSLVNLKRLSIQNKDISVLSNDVGSLINLETLAIDDTSIEEIPESIGNCARLKLLYIRYSKITMLPESIKNCIDLENVFCDSDQQSSIKEQLESLGMNNVEV